MSFRWAVLVILVSVSVSCTWTGAPALANHYDAMAQVSADGKNAVASVNSIATQLGMRAFAQGGNAIDAAAAVAFGLGVVDTPNSGIGGGCFILVHWASGEIEAIDGREMAPGAATSDMFLVNGEYQPQLSKIGALAVGVPGSVAALEYLVQKGGKLGWEKAILPAAQVAEHGFTVDPIYHKRLQRAAQAMQQFPESQRIFFGRNGEPPAVGAVFKQPDLAETYKKLAKKGADYFYRGEFADRIAAWMQQNKGLITKEDFAEYTVMLRAPVESEFQGYRIVGFPPPSSGGAHVAQVLNILDLYPLASLSDTERYHLEIEAMKRAFADRAFWMGDADFVDVPKGIVEKSYAHDLAKGIQPHLATEVTSHGHPPNAKTHLFNRHTTHIAVADAHGNWVAITTTLNTGFGSKVTIPGTGVVMNNQMDDFTAQLGKANAFGLLGREANQIQARKRPLSSMSPTLVLKGDQPVMTLGAAGGPTIINQVISTLVNRLALQMPLGEAMRSPRVHHQWQPDKTLVDPHLDHNVRATLESYGHVLVDWPDFGSTQAIVREEGRLVPVAEPRLEARIQK